jgi:hypothetical protein
LSAVRARSSVTLATIRPPMVDATLLPISCSEMKKTCLLLSVFFLLGCSQLEKDNEPQEPVDLQERLVEVKHKQQVYCELSQTRYESQGWVHSKCDGLLFTSIHGLVCDYVSVNQFQKLAGLWKRSPTQDCFANGESKTGISRDMLTGLLLYAWHHERRDILVELIAYGEDNGWDMCDGEHKDEQWRLGRCVVSPTLKATIYELSAQMGNDCDTRCAAARLVPQVWDPHQRSFPAHLLQLHFLVRGLAQGALNDNQIDQLRWQVERVPQNALFRANYALWTTGDMTEVVNLLLFSPRFPEDRLPGSGEHCTDYLWQRDPGADWQPCAEENQTHYGTDYLLVSAIVLGELRGQ